MIANGETIVSDKKTAGIFLRNIDESDHRRFKALCASEGMNMSAALIEYIEACLRKNTLIVSG